MKGLFSKAIKPLVIMKVYLLVILKKKNSYAIEFQIKDQKDQN